MRVTINEVAIHDVYVSDSGRKRVVLRLNEEDLFEMFDNINPKNIVKYLDMRNVNHRQAPQVNIYECKNKKLGKRNKKKLERCLNILDAMTHKESL